MGVHFDGEISPATKKETTTAPRLLPADFDCATGFTCSLVYSPVSMDLIDVCD